MSKRFGQMAVAVATVAAGIGGLQTAGVGQAARSDVITANRFSLAVDGREIATFSELSGIVAEVEPSAYWDTGTSSPQVAKSPNTAKPPTLVLTRGMNDSREMWSWHETIRRGQMSAGRRSCTLTMLNSEGKAVGKYWLENAWPSKIETRSLKAGASDALIETVTLTAQHIQRIAP